MRKYRDPGLSAVYRVIRPGKLAEKLGKTPQSISNWKTVPLEQVPEIARVTGLHPLVIRPDYFIRLREFMRDGEAA